MQAYAEKQKSQHQHDAWIMWHGAVIPKLKKLPPLSDFTGIKKPVKGIDEHAIIARLKEYQKRYKDGDSSAVNG